MGSLLKNFAYGGLPRGKKFCGFEQRLVQNKKYTELLMGENQSLQARFFPAKRLSYFFGQHQTPFQSTDFFFHGQISRL